MPRALLPLVLLAAVLAAEAPAQSNSTPTQLVWALDAGGVSGAPTLMRVYDPSGREVAAITPPGTGSARSLSFDRSGNGYLARGDVVHQLDRLGIATGIVFAAPTGASAAQDFAQLPTGEFIGSFGVTTATSLIGRYDPAGNLLTTIAGTMLAQPRRIVPRPENGQGTVYIANRDGNSILEINYLQPTPIITQTIDLTTPNIGPVGLAG